MQSVSKETIKKAIRLYIDEDQTGEEACAATGISMATLHKYCSRYGIKKGRPLERPEMRGPTSMTAKVWREAQLMYWANWRVVDIAKKLGVNYRTLLSNYQRAIKAGDMTERKPLPPLKPPPIPTKYTKKQIRRALDMWMIGMHHSLITEETGVHRNTISKYAKREGIKRGTVMPFKSDVAEIRNAVGFWRAGYSVQYVEERTGITRNQIYNYARRMGIERKRTMPKSDRTSMLIDYATGVDGLEEKYGVAMSAISQAAFKAGVVRPSYAKHTFDFAYDQYEKIRDAMPVGAKGCGPWVLLSILDSYGIGDSLNQVMCFCHPAPKPDMAEAGVATARVPVRSKKGRG